MTTKLLRRLIIKSSLRLAGMALVSIALLGGCANAPKMSHPSLLHIVGSDFLNYTINYEMTDKETHADAITFKWSKEGFPIIRHPLFDDADYWHKAVSLTDWNATATEWQFQVFDQNHKLICSKNWSDVPPEGSDYLECNGVLKGSNQYITLQMDFVLHGKHGPGANYLTSSHTLRLIPGHQGQKG